MKQVTTAVLYIKDENLSGSVLNLLPAWQAQKGGWRGGGRKARKRGKGKGAPAIRAGVFVFRPPFSELML